jgi:alpha-tubulin suppressor-like RCC1 family protein
MFLSNWLVFKIVLAAVTGLVDYPLAADVLLVYDNANKLYLDGNSIDYVSNVVLYKGETSYEIEGPNFIAGDEQKITASDAASSDQFGYSVVIDGDYAIIGSVNNNTAYIFKRDGSTGVWAEQTKLIPTSDSQNSTSDNFGQSVSISGNYAIVGAPEYNHNQTTNAGAAYIFVRSGTTWAQQEKLIASDLGGYDFFGRSVSISGEYAIIGAPLWDIGSSDTIEGVAYIFKRDGTSWSEQQKLIASDAGANDNFGASVSISGDYAIVGAWPEDEGGSDAGAAYIFKREGTSWSEQYKLIASDSQSNDNFGWSVDIDGDYVVIGAKNGDSNVIDSGSAYIFKRDGTTWSQQAKLTASDAAATDRFGWSVSISGNYAIVGAYNNDDNNASSSGSAYIFKRSGTTWSEQQKLLASDPAQDDEFGESVAISEDCVIVGAYRKNSYTGAAYIYPLKEVTNYYITQPGTYRADLQICGIDYKTNEVEVTSLNPGNAVYANDLKETSEIDHGTSSSTLKACSVSLDGTRVALGADDGRVKVYHLESGVWTLKKEYTKTSNFGTQVCLNDAGTRLFVSDPADNSNTGKVYVYDYTGGAWGSSETHSWVSPDGNANDYFGGVAGKGIDCNSDGTRLLVTTGYTGIKKAWIFDHNGTNWNTAPTKTWSSGSAWWGTTCALNDAGDRAFIGYENGVDIFHYDGSNWPTSATKNYTGSGRFGASLTINGAGTRLLVGAYDYSTNNGQTTLYDYTGSSWNTSATQTINGSNGTATYYGHGINMSRDGKRYLVSTHGSSTYFSNGGFVELMEDTSGSGSFTLKQTFEPGQASEYMGSYQFHEGLCLDQKGYTAVILSTGTDVSRIYSSNPIPTLTFDNYNKFSLTNTPTYTSSKLAYYSNVYDVGTLTDKLYIENPGDYTSVTFDTSSNVAYFSNAAVGAVGTTLAEHELEQTITGYATSDSPSQGSMGSYIDFSGDGTRMVVGMGLYNSNQGRAAVYHLEDGSWVQKVDLAPTASSTRFGDSVLMNEDGTRIAVNYYPNNTIKIYEYTNGAWPTSPTTSISGTFSSGDMDWNTDGTVLAIAQGGGSGNNAYIYTRDSGTGNWSLTKTWSGAAGVEGCFAINGAGTRIILGASRSSGTTNNWNGSIYEANYDSGTSTWSSLTEVGTYNNTGNTHWPIRLRMSNDGTRLIAVGSAAGDANIWDRQSGTSWTKTLDIPGISSGYSRGSGSISYDGNMVLTGDNYYAGTASYQGRAYLYEYANGSWSLTKTYENPKTTPVANDYWGYGTAITKLKDRIAIGMSGDDTAGTDYGSVYVYSNEIPKYLDFDTYNKLSIQNITPTATTLKYGSNTYDIGTISDVYIANPGTYEAAITASDKFALVSNVVSGTISGSPIRQVSAGGNVSLALTQDGFVYAWGEDTYGQMGQGTTDTNVNTPVKVKGVGGSGFLSNITKISCGGRHCIALASDGTLYAWGDNTEGQIGDASNTERKTPVTVSYSGDPVSNISAGFLHSALTTTTGKVYCWGQGTNGQIGDNQSSSDRTVPTQVVGVGNSGTLEGIRDVTCGDSFTHAIKDSDGSVYAWGKNTYGMLGDGTTTDRTTPVPVILAGGSAVTGITQISGGGDYALMLKSDGTVYACGYGSNGQLGDGSISNNDTGLVQVQGVGGSGNLTSITQIAAAESTSLALKNDGTMYSWGGNIDGQNGLGTVGGTNPTTPVAITLLTGVDSINAGGKPYHFIASKSDGSVFCWGKGDSGQLGDGTNTADQGTPTQVIAGAGPSIGGKFNLFTDPKLDFDTYNKLSIQNITPTSTTLKYGSNTYDLGTRTNIYIENDGTYEIETKDANTFVFASNTATNVTENPPNIDTVIFSKIGGSSWTYNSTITDIQLKDANDNLLTIEYFYFPNSNGGNDRNLQYINSSSGTLFSNVTDGSYSSSDVTNGEYAYRNTPETDRIASFLSTTFNGYADGTEIMHVKAVSGTVAKVRVVWDRQLYKQPMRISNSGKTYDITVGSSSYQGLDETYTLGGSFVGFISFDTYNKLFISGITPTATTLKYGSNTYDIGTATNIYIANSGTYAIETKDVNTFALASNVVGTVSQHPTDVVPSLTHDGYNKLSIQNITPISTSLRLGSNTYDIGTATNIYVEDYGTYEIGTKDANTFALASNVVSSVTRVEPGFASRYQGSTALTYDGKLHAWGWNDEGEAGVGTSSDIALPTLCTGITQGTVAKLLSSSDITDNSRGQVSAIKTRDGKIYMAGKGNNYCIPGKTSEQTSFTDVTSYFGDQSLTANNVIMMSFTDRSGAALTESGNVWTWGTHDTTYKALGQANASSSSTPKQINFSPSVSVGDSIAWDSGAGGQWSTSGAVFYKVSGVTSTEITIRADVDGASSQGTSLTYVKNTGYWNDTLQPSDAPHQLTSDSTWANTTSVQVSDKLYLWNGEGALLGALTIPEWGFSSSWSTTPTITKITCGHYHSLALDSSGDVWFWGDVPTSYSSSWPSSVTDEPQKVVDGKNIIGIASNYYTLYAFDATGKMWNAGDNSEGQIGDGTTSGSTGKSLTEVTYFSSKGITINKVYGGGECVYADTSDGYYCWGVGTHGVFGNGSTGDITSGPAKWTNVSNIKKFMLSTQHTTAVTEDGKYYAWGRGYHLSRGDNDTGDISYPKYIDTLPNILAPSFEFDGYDKVLVNKPYVQGQIVKFSKSTQTWPRQITLTDVRIKDKDGNILPIEYIYFPLGDGGGSKDLEYIRPSDSLFSVVTDGSYSNVDSGALRNTPETDRLFGAFSTTYNTYPIGTEWMHVKAVYGSIAQVQIVWDRQMYIQPTRLDADGMTYDIPQGNQSTLAGQDSTYTLTGSYTSEKSSKYTKDTHTYDANQAQIISVSDPGTYDAQIKSGTDFTLTSETIPATKTTGLYTWAFHHGNFDNAYGDGDILTARDNGRFYTDTPSYTGDIGTITAVNPLVSSNVSFRLNEYTQNDSSDTYTTGIMLTEIDVFDDTNTAMTYGTDYRADLYRAAFADNAGDGGSGSLSDDTTPYNDDGSRLDDNVLVGSGGYIGWVNGTYNASATGFDRKYPYSVDDELIRLVPLTGKIIGRVQFAYKGTGTTPGWKVYRGDNLIETTNYAGTDINTQGNQTTHQIVDTVSSTMYTFTPASTLTANVLMVAGGGGGAYKSGGAGGAGGLVYTSGKSLSGNITIVVGNGGEEGINGSTIGYKGKDTSFTDNSTSTIAYGGGGGCSYNTNNTDKDGGSGGGGASGGTSGSFLTGGTGTAGQGNAGGDSQIDPSYREGGGGGGGAGTAGSDAVVNDKSGGDGGKGLYYGNVFGVNYGEKGWFAGGGGGGARYGTQSGYGPGTPGLGGLGGGGSALTEGSTARKDNHGMNHTGGGGGGGAFDEGNYSLEGGAGGSGIVLLQTDVATPNVNSEVKVPEPYYHVLIEKHDDIQFSHLPNGIGSGTNHTNGSIVSNIPRADGSVSNVYYATSGGSGGYFYAEQAGSLVSTVEGIFYPIEQQRYDNILEIGHNSTNDVELEMAADGTAKLYRNNGGNLIAAGTITCFTAGKWHHIALTLDSGGNAVGYVNGYPVVSGTYASAVLPGSRQEMVLYRTGVTATFQKFLVYYFKTYNSVLNQKQIMALAGTAGLGPKLEYDGLNAINVVNTEPGSGTEITIYESNVNDTSNLYVVSCNESSYLLSNAGTYYAQIKGTDTFTITRPLTVTDDHFPLYQYPPIDGTTSGLTTSSTADTFNIWTISGAANGNGIYQAKATHGTHTGGDFYAYKAFNNDVSDETGQMVAASQKTNFGLTLKLPSARTIRKYTIYPVDHSLSTGALPGSSTDPTLSGGDPDYMSRPKSWVIKGSNDGTSWTDLDTVTNQPPSIYGDVHSIDSPASYLYYQLFVVTIVDTSALLRIGEWQLWGDA